MKEAIEKAGFTLSKAGKTVTVMGGIPEIHKVLGGKHAELTNIVNRWIDDASRDHFCGESAKELRDAAMGKQSMKMFSDAQSKIAGTIGPKLMAELTKLSPQRKRKFSSFGGNFSYDRRFEPEPFVKFTTIKSGIARLIDIEIDFSINCTMSSHEINEYGALVWAIADAVEKAGIQTTISLVVNTDDVDYGRSINSKVGIRLKEAGQYIAPSFLAGCMSSNFYRRFLFSMIAMACRSEGKQETSGLGFPRQAAIVRSEKGKLFFGPKVGPGHMKEVEKEILKAIAG